MVFKRWIVLSNRPNYWLSHIFTSCHPIYSFACLECLITCTLLYAYIIRTIVTYITIGVGRVGLGVAAKPIY
jgi:hypothetical protein